MNPQTRKVSGMAGITSIPTVKSSATKDIPGEILNLDYMKDCKPGPLDVYRKKALFNWKQMRYFLDGEDIIKFKVRFQLAHGEGYTLLTEYTLSASWVTGKYASFA